MRILGLYALPRALPWADMLSPFRANSKGIVSQDNKLKSNLLPNRVGLVSQWNPRTLPTAGQASSATLCLSDWLIEIMFGYLVLQRRW